MMTSCLSTDTSWLSQVSQLKSTNQTSKTDDTNAGNGIGMTPSVPPHGGDFLNAITQALKPLGAGRGAAP